MRELCFSSEGGSVPELLRFTAENPFGTEIYTSLKLCGAEPRIGSLWTGTDKSGALRELRYDNGEYVTLIRKKSGNAVRVNGAELFGRMPRKNRLCKMTYRGGALTVPGKAVRLHGTELIRIYQAVRESDTLSDSGEKRYVYRVLTDNAGLSDSFAVYEDGRVAATASVCAKNEKFALIGDVYTLYPYRYQGYATLLVRACTAAALEQGLVPVLYCEKELKKMYRKMGYKEYRKEVICKSGFLHKTRMEKPNSETLKAPDEIRCMKTDPSIGKSYTDANKMVDDIMNKR